MRYFYCGCSFNSNIDTLIVSFGLSREYFPSIKELRKCVKEHHPEAKNIVIISISELSKEDYNTCFEGDTKK